MTRQRVEALRADREAGIDRLPTAEHRRLAERSLLQWYWARLAELDRQEAQAEAACRAEQLRQDEDITRVALPPEQEPASDDPFTRGGGEQPTDPDPFGGPVERGAYDDPFSNPAPGESSGRGAENPGADDPFSGPVDRGVYEDPYRTPRDRQTRPSDPRYERPRTRVYQPQVNPRGARARDPRVPQAPDRRESRRRGR
jgi:hypothetical protein